MQKQKETLIFKFMIKINFAVYMCFHQTVDIYLWQPWTRSNLYWKETKKKLSLSLSLSLFFFNSINLQEFHDIFLQRSSDTSDTSERPTILRLVQHPAVKYHQRDKVIKTLMPWTRSLRNADHQVLMKRQAIRFPLCGRTTRGSLMRITMGSENPRRRAVHIVVYVHTDVLYL